MSGQLSDEEKASLNEAFKDFSSGKKESELASPKTDEGTDGKPERETGRAADASADSGASGKKAAPGIDKPRGEDGKFVEKAKPVKEPFEGFSDLKPEQQEAFKKVLGERDKFKNDYSAAVGKLQVMQQEARNLNAQMQRPQQTQSEQKQSLKSVNDFLNSPKFKEFEARYPEDAAGIRDGFQQTVDQLRSEATESSKPLADKISQLESRLGEYERQSKVSAAEQVVQQLDDLHPEWKHIAGWVDDDGNEVPMGQREWHPWFQAWKDQLPYAKGVEYDRLLKEQSAKSIAKVLTHFKQDVQSLMDASGQQADDQNASNVQQRRSDALRDISPRPTRSGTEQPVPKFNGAATDRNVVLSQLYEKWKAGAKLT